MPFLIYLCMLSFATLTLECSDLDSGESEGSGSESPMGGRWNRPVKYHHYKQLIKILNEMEKEHPGQAHTYSIGKSVEKRDIKVLRITNATDGNGLRRELVPMVKLVANIHGNEAVGRSILVEFAKYLLEMFKKKDRRVVEIMNSVDIHILPTLNPDGFEASEEGTCGGTTGRPNKNDVDLNRDFPGPGPQLEGWQRDRRIPDKNMGEGLIQPETAAVVKWTIKRPFVLAANFHGGDCVVNYPFDHPPNEENTDPPDRDVFVHISKEYAKNHKYFTDPKMCPSYGSKGGIVEGWKWYKADGTMQDFNYLYLGIPAVTVELTTCKHPNESALAQEFENNLNSLLAYVETVLVGIKGTVKSVDFMPLEHAKIHVKTMKEKDFRSTVTYSSKKGEFWRILLPGSYQIKVVYEKVESKLFNVTVYPMKVTAMLVRMDVAAGDRD